MNLYIQDPTFPEEYSLHEALIHACDSTSYGAGAFAFVTSGGVRLFLEDPAFDKLVSKDGFKLIVGIDEITSEKALMKLQELKSRYPKLEVYAFLHDTKGSLFHPKFCWFKRNTGGMLVVGSGNLTEKGLRRNREAFGLVELNEAKTLEIEELWNRWLSHNAVYLRQIDDPKVLEKARKNIRIYSTIKEKVELDIEAEDQVEDQPEPDTHPDTKEFEPEDLEAWNFTDEDAVLVAEIPNNNTRWKQANFSKEAFEQFFGAKAGNNDLRILLRNVLDDGAFSHAEVRQSVSVASQNYRFELGAAAGLVYPDNGRPIGVFIRVSTRMFLYILAMPTDTYYPEVRSYLDAKIPSAAGMKRYRTNVEELKANCSHLPFWQIA